MLWQCLSSKSSPLLGVDLRSRTVKLKLRHEPIPDIGCAQARDRPPRDGRPVERLRVGLRPKGPCRLVAQSGGADVHDGMSGFGIAAEEIAHSMAFDRVAYDPLLTLQPEN